MSSERMLDKEKKPERSDIASFIGQEALEAWDEIVDFIENNYNFTPETVYGGKKYGWEIRYRRSGKSLCTLYPEKGAFTVQIVLGMKESGQATERLHEFSPEIADLITNTDQLHDGRWLWIRVPGKDTADDTKRLIQIKKKPQKNREDAR